jgi:hypothetical protein
MFERFIRYFQTSYKTVQLQVTQIIIFTSNNLHGLLRCDIIMSNYTTWKRIN